MESGELTETGLGHVRDLPGGIVKETPGFASQSPDDGF